MAGQLVQVATNTITSAVASVSLVGINSDDVYMVAFSNVAPATDGEKLRIRFTVSGSPDSSSNYDKATKKLRTDTTFSDISSLNQDHLRISSSGIGTGTSETDNGILYLYNFNNSSEFSFVTIEESMLSNTAGLRGDMGGGVLTEAQACDGIQFLMSSGNLASGTFTLFMVI
jgi:hypothetical protein